MSYYLRKVQVSHSSSIQVWKIEHDVAVHIGVSNPESTPGCYFKANPGETIWDAIRRTTPWFAPDGKCPFHRTKLRPGEYYPRMARPIDQHPDEAPGWSPGARSVANVIAVARGQLTALTRQLEHICRTVHPSKETFEVFGHDIRNLLILACTEVESHLRGILVANGMSKKSFSIRDYIRLVEPMKLDEYGVDFPSYPWLPPIKPFIEWRSKDGQIHGLNWYHAYNAVKHNREDEFGRATLRHAFEAVTACAIMMAAQFGLPEGLGQRSELQAFFHVSAIPAWPLSEVYIYPYGERSGDWIPVQFDLSSKSA